MSDDHISETQAIKAALSQDWKEAIRINLLLLKHDKNNLSLLNRLGFAYLQNGEFTSAKKAYCKVLKLDPYNQIAQKNVKKTGTVKQKDILKIKRTEVAPLSFLEEPGKTKIVECVNAAPISVLSAICPGEVVELKAKNHVVEVRSARHVYLGALPDDLSYRLIKLLSFGNTYQILVKSVRKNSLVVFIREISRGKRLANQPSFAATALYIPFTKVDHPTDASEADSDSDESEGDA